MTTEGDRRHEAWTGKLSWKTWGPYPSDRQWGTVREDYSGNGDAWNFFAHDHARSRAYRFQLFGMLDPAQLLEGGRDTGFARRNPEGGAKT